MDKSYVPIREWLSLNVDSTSTKISYRLPTNLVPYHYDIKVTTQFENETGKSFAFEGFVRMNFICQEDTNDLVFHLNNIDIDNATLRVKQINDSTFKNLTNFKWYNDYERQFFIANLSETFKASRAYSVEVHYIGYLKYDNVGFYGSSYADSQNNKR